MHRLLKILIATSVLTAGLLTAPVVLYAHEEAGGMTGGRAGNMMGNGAMMGQGSGGMMGGPGGMMGRMAENCSAMMTSMISNHGAAPNQQWKRNQPSAPLEHHNQSE